MTTLNRPFSEQEPTTGPGSLTGPFNEPLNSREYPNRPGREITHGLNEGFSGTQQEALYWPAHIGGAPIGVNDVAGEQREAAAVKVNFGLAWALEGFVAKTISVPWQISGYARKELSATWTTWESVAESLTSNWVAYLTAQKSLSATWHSYTIAAKSVAAEWNLLQVVVKSNTAEWNQVGVVQRNLTAPWNIPNLFPVYINTQFFWDSGSAAQPGVKVTLSAKWNSVGPVNKQLYGKWGVKSTFALQRSIRWRTLSDYYPAVPTKLQRTGSGYLLDVLHDRPAAYWRLADTAAPFVDRAGSSNALVTGVPVFGQHTLLSSLSKSTLFNNTTYASAATEGRWFMASQEFTSCALEAWIRVAPTQESVILGRGGTGILINTQGIGFRATTTGGIHDLIIPVETWAKNYHVVATYNNRAINLYINGREAGSMAIPEDVQFTNTSPTVEFGRVEGYMQDVAVYDHNLSRDRVRDHYRRGTRHLEYQQVVMADEPNGFWSISDNYADVAQEFTERVEALDETVEYLTSYILDLSGTAQAGKIQWRTNTTALVETSFNGLVWDVVTNDSRIRKVDGTDLTGKELFVRVTLTGPGYLDLCVVTYNTNSVTDVQQIYSPALVIGDSIIGEDQPIATADDKKGLIGNGGGLTIPAHNYQAVELWLRRTGDTTLLSTTNGQISFAGGFSATGVTRFVINGEERAPVAADFPLGVWVHLYAELTDTSAITLGSADIDDIATYAAPLSLDRIARHYLAARVGRSVSAVRDTGLSVIEHDYDLAQHTWTLADA